MISAREAKELLTKGDETFIGATANPGDISLQRREDTAAHGQHPYAVVVACSDSRAIPEAVFSCGIGEIFVIRNVGNIVGPQELGCIEYATKHLGCRLVVIMGHTNCGAINTALSGGADGNTSLLVDKVKSAIGDEKDEIKACLLNIKAGVDTVLNDPYLSDEFKNGLEVVGALHHIDDGRVEFI